MEALNLFEYFGEKPFSRKDLFSYVTHEDPSFQETQMRYLLGNLIASKSISRIARNQYVVQMKENAKQKFSNPYSDKSFSLIEIMLDRFPLINFRVWELCWLNEFFNHQIARNKIFVEVEKEGCEFVFDALRDIYSVEVLYRPSEPELYRYGQDDGIIVDRLIAEAPSGSPEKYNVALEKLIVDLFANKLLRSMVSQGDYPLALSQMFAVYAIDQSKLFRYARRRNKEKVIRDFINQNTSIKLL